MMLIDDSVLHVINAFQAPGALGLYGVWRYFQRRNGNGTAKRSDIEAAEKRINNRITGLETRFVNWIGDVEKKGNEDREKQADYRERLARLEGPLSKRGE